MAHKVQYGPMADGTVGQVLNFKPPVGRSGIYVIRPGGIVGAAVPWEVDLDADLLGKMWRQSYVYAPVPPGLHNLRTMNQDEGLTFNTEADHNYFFIIKSSFTNQVQPISEERGREIVLEYAK
jgi:hypothetical protein